MNFHARSRQTCSLAWSQELTWQGLLLGANATLQLLIILKVSRLIALLLSLLTAFNPVVCNFWLLVINPIVYCMHFSVSFFFICICSYTNSSRHCTSLPLPFPITSDDARTISFSHLPSSTKLCLFVLSLLSPPPEWLIKAGLPRPPWHPLNPFQSCCSSHEIFT